MPSNVDNRIVNMQFNNKQFESGVAQTMSTLDKFKEKLNFSKSANALGDLEKAANKVDLSGLQSSFSAVGSAVETVQTKFSAWEIAAKRVIENVVDNAYEGAKRFAKSLSIDQITAGWEKYGEVASSVATIMSATGLSVEDVTDQLERLNWYTDETSYSYQDMASNIGKFTSQKIPLEQATEQMMGIANWAALAGQGAGEASRAMYNIAQSMGQGYMSLMDWRSIENANMGTAQFKEMVMDIAASMGYLKETTDETGAAIYKTFGTDGTNGSIVNAGTFAQTLSEKWFNKDVMQEAFSQYGKFSVKLNEVITNLNEADEDLDISATDLIGILNEYAEDKSLDALNQRLRGTGTAAKDVIGYLDLLTSKEYELSRKAFSAAQEYRTFNDAIDATKDAVSTQWMNTFTAIFGNYEEAKELWTSMGGALYDVFATAGEERNAVLREWKGLGEGGRDDLVTAITESLDSIVEIVFAVKDGLERVFPAMTAESVANIVKSFKTFADTVSEFTSSESNMTKLSISVGNIVRAFKNIADLVGGIFRSIKEAFVEVFAGNVTIDSVQKLTQSIRDFTAKLVPSAEGLNTFNATLVTVFKIIKPIVSGITKVTKGALNGVVKIGGFALEIIKGIAKFFTGTIKGVADWFKSLGENTKFSESIQRLKDAFKKLFSVLGGNASKGFEAVGNFFAKLGDSEKITNALSKFSDVLTIIVTAVADFVSAGVEKVADFFKNHNLVEEATNIWNSFKDSIVDTYRAVKDFLAPATEWISDKAEAVYNSVSKYFGPAKEKIKDFFDEFKGKDAKGVFSTIGDKFGEFGKTVWDWAQRLWTSLTTEWIPAVKDWIKNHFPYLYEWFEKIKDWFTDFAKSDDKFGFLKDSIKSFSDAIGDFATKAWKTLKDVWAWLKEEFNNIGPAGVVLAAFAGALIALLVHLMDALEGLANPIKTIYSIFSKTGESISGFFDTLKKTTKLNQTANAINTIAGAIKTLAISLAILTISVSIISKTEDPWAAVAVIGALATGLVMLMLAAKFFGTVKDQDGNLKAIGSFGEVAKMLLAVAISLFAFVTVIRNAGEISSEKFWSGLGRAILSLFTIVAALKVLTTGNSEKVAVKGALSILAIVIALDFMMKSIARLKVKGMDDAITKIMLMGVVALALGSLAKAFKKSETTDKGGTTKSTISLLGIAGVMLAFVYVLKQLSKISLSDVQVGPILVAVGIAIAALAGITLATKGAGDNVLKVGLGLITLAKAIQILISVMSSMGDIKVKNLAIVGAVFVALIGSITGLLAVTKLKEGDKSGAKGAALEIAALAAALTLMGVSMGLLALVPWKKLIAPALAMTAFLLGMATVVYAAGKAGAAGDNGYKTVIAAGILIAIIGAVIGVLAALNIEQIKTSAKIVLAVIGLTAVLLFAVGYFNKGTTTQVVDVKKEGMAAVELITGVAIIAGLAFLLVAIAKELNGLDATRLPKFATALIMVAGGAVLVAGAILLLSKNLPDSIKEAAKVVGIGLVGFLSGAAALVIAALALAAASKILGATRVDVSFGQSMLATVAVIALVTEAIIGFSKQLPEKGAFKAIGVGITAFISGAVAIIGAAAALKACAAILGDTRVDVSFGQSMVATTVVIALISEAIIGFSKQLPPKGAFKAIAIGLATFIAGSIALIAASAALLAAYEIMGSRRVDKSLATSLYSAVVVIGLISEALVLFATQISKNDLKIEHLGKSMLMFLSGAVLLVGVAGALWVIDKILKGQTVSTGIIEKLAATSAIVAGISEALVLFATQIANNDLKMGHLGKAMLMFVAGLVAFVAVAWVMEWLSGSLKNVNLDPDFLSKLGAIGIAFTAMAAATELLILFAAEIKGLKLDSGSLLRALEAMAFGFVTALAAGGFVLLVQHFFEEDPIDIASFSKNMLAITEALAVLSVGAAAIIGLGKFAGSVMEPLKGMAAIAILILGISILAALFAGLNKKIPGFKDFIVEGFEILGIVVEAIADIAGRAISKFVDSAICDSIRYLGESLGDFWEGAKPFFDGLVEFGGDIVTLMGNFAKALLLLTAAELVQGLANILTLGGASRSVSDTLADFGNGIRRFYENAGPDVKPKRVVSLSDAVKTLIEVMSNVPIEGGLVGLIIGGRKFDKFADGMSEMGKSLYEFYLSSLGVVPERVDDLADVLDKLVTTLANVPVEGGFVGMIIGKRDLTGFAEAVGELGNGLYSFAKQTEDIDQTKVDNAVNSLKLLVELNNLIPRSDGLLQALAGERDMSKFAQGTSDLGDGLSKFVRKTKDLDTSGVESATNALKLISAFSDTIPRSDGLLQWVIGDVDMAGFAEKLPSLGVGISSFAQQVRYMFNVCGDDIVDRIKDTGTMLDIIGDFQSSLSREGGLWQAIAGGKGEAFGVFASTLGTLGNGLKDFSKSMSEVDEADYDLALNVSSRFMNIARNVSTYRLDTILYDYVSNIMSMADGLKYFTDKVSSVSGEGLDVGLDFASKFINLAQDVDWEDVLGFCNAFSALATLSIDLFIQNFTDRETDALATGSKFLTKVLDGVQYVIDSGEVGTLKRARDMIDIFLSAFAELTTTGNAMQAGSDFVKAIYKGFDETTPTPYDKAVEIGENIGQGLIDGMRNKQPLVTEKAETLGNGIIMTIENSVDSHSPSRATERIGRFIDLGLINGMNEYSDGVALAAANVGDTSVQAMIDAIARIRGALTDELDDDYTIRPVLDLTNISAGSGLMSQMLTSPYLNMPGLNPILGGGYSAELAASLAGQNGIGNSGLISSILDHIDMLSGDIQSMQLVMDSGALVGSIASPMDNTLGRMAVYKGRGN